MHSSPKRTSTGAIWALARVAMSEIDTMMHPGSALIFTGRIPI
jgi:hypothetical protein